MTTDPDGDRNSELAQLTADIVMAYVGHNPMPPEQLPELIGEVHRALHTVSDASAIAPEPERQPAVPVRRSVTDDAISCLYCGKSFSSLKKHIGMVHDVTPEEYREVWNLRSDYPMTAPSYARARSAMAKELGLGRRARPR